jgi:hypothetical protein
MENWLGLYAFIRAIAQQLCLGGQCRGGLYPSLIHGVCGEWAGGVSYGLNQNLQTHLTQITISPRRHGEHEGLQAFASRNNEQKIAISLFLA